MGQTKRGGMLYTQCLIPINNVIVFPQVRKTFDQELITELADDIATNGIIYPPVFAKLSEEKFKAYKTAFELISGKQLNEIHFPTHKGYYYCLIAGERRFRAHKQLWEHGCTECNAVAKIALKELKPGQCYHSHYGDSHIEGRACLNIDPLSAKSIQFRENNHVKPPFHEEADEYDHFFRYMQLGNPKLNLTEFAKIVGVSKEKVRRALWFRELPESVQDAARQGYISYSNAIELRRINDLPASLITEEKRADLLLEQASYLLLHPRIKNDEYRKRLRERLANLNNNTLFDVTPFIIKEKGKRKIVEEHLIPHLMLLAKYIKKVGELQKTGSIGKEQIFAGGSPTNQLKVITEELQTIIPGFELSMEQLKAIGLLNLENKSKTREAG
ncbi:MAG: hypothetical protein ABIO57_02610 [Candidatus Paceibacterota bacterium]